MSVKLVIGGSGFVQVPAASAGGGSAGLLQWTKGGGSPLPSGQFSTGIHPSDTTTIVLSKSSPIGGVNYRPYFINLILPVFLLLTDSTGAVYVFQIDSVGMDSFSNISLTVEYVAAPFLWAPGTYQFSIGGSSRVLSDTQMENFRGVIGMDALGVTSVQYTLSDGTIVYIPLQASPP